MSTDLHTLSGAYALDALSADEAAAFDTHMSECPACRLEVLELREAAGLMGAAQRTEVPPGLKARVLAAADRTAQQPPKVTSIDAARQRSWRPKLAVAAAAAVLVAGGAVGIGQMLGSDEAPLAAGVEQVFEATDANTAEVVTEYGVVRVATSPERNEMAVDATDLESLDERLVYKVWSIAAGQPALVTVLDADTTGASMPLPAAGTEVAITVEPADGPDLPTTEPIVRVDPASV